MGPEEKKAILESLVKALTKPDVLINGEEVDSVDLLGGETLMVTTESTEFAIEISRI